MSRKTDQELEKYLRGESPLSRAYRAGREEEPPELLDARIRREARAALGSSKASRPWLTRWAPLAAAAVIVMSISVVLFRFDRAESPLPAGGDVATTPMAETVRRVAEPPAKDAHKAAPAPFPADRVDTRMKKELHDAPAVMSAPPAATEAVSQPARVGAMSVPAAPAPADLSKLKSDRARMAPQSRTEAVGAAAPTTTQGFRMMAEERKPEQAKRAAASLADVTAVSVAGEPGAYRFNVTIRSPDKGCAQYANWWEVVGEDGRLLYRRVLLHSHVDEQPFSRDGGPVPIGPDTVVWVRAHQHPGGYGGAALKGSVRAGFRAAVPPAGFAANLTKAPPLPTGCDF